MKSKGQFTNTMHTILHIILGGNLFLILLCHNYDNKSESKIRDILEYF